jgi:dTDP-4-dehydrorhamnose reductase
MLGHKLYQTYKEHFDIWGTLRSSYENYAKYGIYQADHIWGGVDACDFDKIVEVIRTIKPHVVINCIGIIKQLKEAKDPVLSIKINSLLPHQLANICQETNARFFQLSTDCVFNGKKGKYTENDPSDAEDLYGRTKFLGEVNRPGCLTLRTSMIGREIKTTNELIEWFLSNKGKKVKGFKKAIYTGFTTIAFVKIIATIIDEFPNLSGLYQVSSEPIDKFTLLTMIRDKFKLDIEIEPETQTNIDRSLDSSLFRKITGFTAPSWDNMIDEMTQDKTPYDLWHK